MKKIIFAVIFVLLASVVFLVVGNRLKFEKYNFDANTINGRATMSTFDGKYKIIYFGYTFCPDVCPTTLSLVSTVLNDIKAKNVMILFSTLDLKRDDVKNCDEFIKYFYLNSLCIRLDNDKILRKVADNYGVKYKIINLDDSAMGYSVAHSSSIYLFDKKGNFVKEVSNLTYDNVKNEIENLLKNH